MFPFYHAVEFSASLEVYRDIHHYSVSFSLLKAFFTFLYWLTDHFCNFDPLPSDDPESVVKIAGEGQVKPEGFSAQQYVVW